MIVPYRLHSCARCTAFQRRCASVSALRLPYTVTYVREGVLGVAGYSATMFIAEWVRDSTGLHAQPRQEQRRQRGKKRDGDGVAAVNDSGGDSGSRDGDGGGGGRGVVWRLALCSAALLGGHVAAERLLGQVASR
jgi:hypothetical protein